MIHAMPDHLASRKISITVVGCGGTGSAIAGGLPYLDQALRAWGHDGIEVSLMDGDLISETNCVRQPFCRSEIGLSKAVVLASRTNCFWGTSWHAETRFLKAADMILSDIVIGCVDSRRARAALREASGQCVYWLDIGNSSAGGQFVLGQPGSRNKAATERLPTAPELFPEICDATLDSQDGPSCSAIEALDRQEPFVNQVLANHALALLTRLCRYGQIEHHGGFVNLESGLCSPIPVDPAYWKSLRAA